MKLERAVECVQAMFASRLGFLSDDVDGLGIYVYCNEGFTLYTLFRTKRLCSIAKVFPSSLLHPFPPSSVWNLLLTILL